MTVYIITGVGDHENVVFHSLDLAHQWMDDHEHQGPFGIVACEIMDTVDGHCSECPRPLVANSAAWMCTCGRRFEEPEEAKS